jgi:hypothetical protein
MRACAALAALLLVSIARLGIVVQTALPMTAAALHDGASTLFSALVFMQYWSAVCLAAACFFVGCCFSMHLALSRLEWSAIADGAWALHSPGLSIWFAQRTPWLNLLGVLRLPVGGCSSSHSLYLGFLIIDGSPAFGAVVAGGGGSWMLLRVVRHSASSCSGRASVAFCCLGFVDVHGKRIAKSMLLKVQTAHISQGHV